MIVDFVPLTPSLLPACKAFNKRLRGRGDPPFLLPDEIGAAAALCGGSAGIPSAQYLALDRDGAVRGGVLLLEQRGWIGGNEVRLTNAQSPLSEGIADSRFAGVGLQIVKLIERRSPYAYAVGMGSEQMPFPRLLRSCGWSVSAIPFFFAVGSAARFLGQIGILRRGARGWLAQGLAVSGLGSLGLAAWQSAHVPQFTRLYSLETAHSWPENLNAVWERCRTEVSFSLLRDEPSLADLYPDSQPRLKRFVLCFDGAVVGWSVALVTKMHSHPHFGNLTVGTILDGLASGEHVDALAALTCSAVREMGAELLLTNQAHLNWRSALRRLGFISYSSNYLVALSKPLAEALQSQPGALDRIHVNRGDGDGRIHL
ncbi:MAG TPA: hypothetical protein VMG31_01790 [Verrucomicrobiae bacterium]|nr:hypothetical protein [Verrucomicrobiae bacterium]